MWNKRISVLVGIAVFWSGQAYSEEGELGARISYQRNQASSSSFAVPELFRRTPSALTQQELYLHLQHGMWTVKAQATATQQVNGGYTDEKGAINEAYADFSLGDVEGSIGKKVVSWGVGYGYRPLDVIQRETRQALRTFDLEGAPMLMLEYFTAESAVTAIVSNRFRFDGFSPQKGEYEGALKYSTLLGNSDVHFLLFQRQGEGASAGAGASTTYGDHLEWHGSLRYLSSYTMLQHKLSGQPAALPGSTDVFATEQHHHGVLALLGASWTWGNSYSLMLEAWHDDTAWSRSQWQELLRINDSQHQKLSVGVPEQAAYGNVNANSRVYSQQNLLKDTLFMRLSYDGDSFDPNLSLLYTPADGGMVFTASADYNWSDHIRLFGSARVMGGKKNSAYRNAADRWQVFIGLQISGSVL